MLHLKNQPFEFGKSSGEPSTLMTLGPFFGVSSFFGFSSSLLPELPPPPSPTSRKRSQLGGTKEESVQNLDVPFGRKLGWINGDRISGLFHLLINGGLLGL